MPIPFAGKVFSEGFDSVPWVVPILKAAPWIAVLALLKRFFGGARNASERDMHGKVILVTGGTSGVGEAVVKGLATRGAQIVLLTQHALGDPFLVDFIEDVRVETKNQLITAEQVDLASLHSIRQFATKWIDNAPPRRLDMLILCANTIGSSNKKKKKNEEKNKTSSRKEGRDTDKWLIGESNDSIWQTNYAANFHLLSILSPALRAQPPDRDVRIIFGTCASYTSGDLLHIANPIPASNLKKHGVQPETNSLLSSLIPPTVVSPANAYPTSKLALTTFALAFQKHLTAYARPDKFPMNAKVLLVDPGWTRTPGTRRFLTFGSLFGLFLYLLLYPLWWIVLKSPEQGAESFLYAAMEARFARLRQDLTEDFKDGESGGWLVKECAVREMGRKEVVEDADVQKKLWEWTERWVEEAEKRGKVERDRVKREEADKKEVDEAEREMKEYKEKIGKKEGQRKEGSRRSRKAG